VVEKGLQSGQTVVTEGQLRLEAGTKIQTGDGRGGGGRRGGGRGQGQGSQGSQGSQGGQNGQTGQSGQNGTALDAQGQARGRRGE
jgi:hypothetical protein